MFIHIGNANVIRTDSIISIIDQNVIAASAAVEEMISSANKQGQLLGPVGDAKSVVITEQTIYFSPLSVPTLKKRASMISTISKLEDYSDDLEQLTDNE
jgi:regulator of extracellular matrix RemA (YlzA/DUF370 family)